MWMTCWREEKPGICWKQFDVHTLEQECLLLSETFPRCYHLLHPSMLFPIHRAYFSNPKNLSLLSCSNHCFQTQKSCKKLFSKKWKNHEYKTLFLTLYYQVFDKLIFLHPMFNFWTSIIVFSNSKKKSSTRICLNSIYIFPKCHLIARSLTVWILIHKILLQVIIRVL